MSQDSQAQDVPLVSIGLPVYNGAKYLEKAIDSILAQTFTNFELILSDNASTDATPEICQAYAARDPRVRYQRNPANIGGAGNTNLTFTLARGKYFRWAAHDDLCAPELLEKCVAALEADPGLVIAYPMARLIDEQGVEFGITSHKKAASEKNYERFRRLAIADDYCEEIYGVIRTDILRNTRLLGIYTSADRVLLSELGLYGRFYEVPEVLFSKRIHPGNYFVDWRARMVWFDPKLKGKIVFPFWKQFFDYLATVRRVRLTFYEKLRCYLAVFEWVARKRWKSMAMDIWYAVIMLLHNTRWRIQKHERGINWE